MNLENQKEAGRRYIQFKDLMAMGIVKNRVTLGRWMNAGRFPRPIYPETGGSPFWLMDELLAWEEGLKQARG